MAGVERYLIPLSVATSICLFTKAVYWSGVSEPNQAIIDGKNQTNTQTYLMIGTLLNNEKLWKSRSLWFLFCSRNKKRKHRVIFSTRCFPEGRKYHFFWAILISAGRRFHFRQNRNYFKLMLIFTQSRFYIQKSLWNSAFPALLFGYFMSVY